MAYERVIEAAPEPSSCMTFAGRLLHNFLGGVMRVAAKTAPRNIKKLRFLCDTKIPWILVHKGVRIEAETIKTKHGSLDLEWVLPTSVDRSKPDTIGKVMVYMHGGAYVLCTPGSLRWCTAPIARRLDTALCVPDYRRSPEVSVESSIEDCFAAYEHVLQSFPKAVHLVGGESAGGALAANLLLQLRNSHLPQPSSCFLMSPWTDLGGDNFDAGLRHASLKNARFDYLPPDLVSWIAKHARRDLSGDESMISPVHAEGSLVDLPPILVVYGGREVLCGQIERFCDVWASRGAPLQRHMVEEGKHAPILFSSVHGPSNRALDVLAKCFETNGNKPVDSEARCEP
eukprot:TRINITY_DN76526_c0_g1_i1.p1 TRINITY_DN76526_c0_g1~~TRINITY_DN76526_c0_g1_i1.p1  ORF type:complete len:343 (-),score=45.38 TRINITY_DN76526_c0_g1_i1:83-1111(-)